MQECLHRLFSVLCTLCQADIDIRKLVSEITSSLGGTGSSLTNSNQILFSNLVEQMKNLHSTTVEQANHYNHVLANSRSFLQTLCALPIRLYKDKRYHLLCFLMSHWFNIYLLFVYNRLKNSLIPCLMTATFEIDSSRLLIRQYGKDRYIKKYLDYYIKERDSLELGGIVIEDYFVTPSVENAEEDERQRKIARLRRFSQLIPSKLWDLLAVVWLND